MSLNIKNEQVHDLVREAARLTGLSQTAVVEQAVRQMLAGLTRSAVAEDRRRRVDWILKDLDSRLTDEDRERMRAAQDEMYDDETGLPA